MLKGVDISHYQDKVPSGYDFVIMKATEGKNYKDPALDKHYDAVNGSNNGKPNKNKLYGFYHYARPDLGNTPMQEADNFLKYVGHHKGNCIYALDWEGKSLDGKYTLWALAWLNYVYEITGVKPIIYLQQSQAKNRSKYLAFANSDYGLWVARYRGTNNKNPGEIGAWNTWAFYQWTEAPCDQNYFNGNKEQYRKYCKINTVR